MNRNKEARKERMDTHLGGFAACKCGVTQDELKHWIKYVERRVMGRW